MSHSAHNSLRLVSILVLAALTVASRLRVETPEATTPAAERTVVSAR